MKLVRFAAVALAFTFGTPVDALTGRFPLCSGSVTREQGLSDLALNRYRHHIHGGLPGRVSPTFRRAVLLCGADVPSRRAPNYYRLEPSLWRQVEADEPFLRGRARTGHCGSAKNLDPGRMIQPPARGRVSSGMTPLDGALNFTRV
jgi:hypothetical protein